MDTRVSTSLIALLLALSAAPALAQDSAQDVLRQLLPGTQPRPMVVAAAETLGRAEVVRQLTAAPMTRSLGNAPTRVVLGPGRESEAMRQLAGFTAFQTQLGFEPNSDLLTPDAIARLDVIGQALGDPALARSTMVIGVQTNAAGSDEFNKSLANLRARAIVEQLATRRGIPRERLYAVGFGRMGDPGSESAAPGERIRVVNLGATPVEWVGAAAPASRTVSDETAPAAPRKVRSAAVLRHKPARKVSVASVRTLDVERRAPVRRKPVYVVMPQAAPEPMVAADATWFDSFGQGGRNNASVGGGFGGGGAGGSVGGGFGGPGPSGPAGGGVSGQHGGWH